MLLTQAQSLANDILAIAKKNLTAAGHLTPVVILYQKSDSAQYQYDSQIVPVQYANDDEKYQMLSWVQQLIRDLHSVAACHISEAWMATTTPGDTLKTPVRDRDTRSEVIVITFKSVAFSFATILPFNRHEGGTITFGDAITYDVETKIFGKVFEDLANKKTGKQKGETALCH
ncbi:hypothetical protein [Citrifermentans bremense]|uniref:hypothetical protein n=1 Tax=Citrifermentans bremense TaxID=60035 RepID=UPI0004793E93|nr:hypothetical protein [Citrifermentans bremense]